MLQWRRQQQPISGHSDRDFMKLSGAFLACLTRGAIASSQPGALLHLSGCLHSLTALRTDGEWTSDRQREGAFTVPRKHRIEWITTWKTDSTPWMCRFYRIKHVANDASRFHPSVLSDARWKDRCTRIVDVCIDLPIGIDESPHAYYTGDIHTLTQVIYTH